MPKLVPMHSVILSRPKLDDKGKPVKGEKGNTIHEKIKPELHKPFDFTDREVEDLKRSGHTFRTPQKSEEDEGDGKLHDAADVEREARMAQEEAKLRGEGKSDTAGIARAGAAGKAKPPVEETGTHPDPTGDENDEGDEL